ncbi:MAG: hypothetical protein PVG39_09100 [Desulfobacteraceae bacterium]|jgi:NAD(P)H dehydrogenase (quinone)
MGKVIVTGADGNFGSYAANSILNKLNKKDLIFTSPDKKALEKYREHGIDTRYANYADPEQLSDAFRGGDTILMISMPQVGEKRREMFEHIESHRVGDRKQTD